MLLMAYLQKYVSSNAKDVNVKVFNMIARINEAKTLKHLSCNCDCKFDSAACNSNQKWNNETCQCKCKNYQTCKEDCCCPITCICENGKYLGIIIDNSVIVCDDITDSVSTNVTRTMLTNIVIFCTWFY